MNPVGQSGPARTIAAWLVLGAILVLQWFALTARHDDVFVGDAVFFVDADCYSRMTRVASILEGGPWSIREHRFENWPDGTRPHTTAPLDWLIAGTATGLTALGVPLERATDRAGAWVSPVLALAVTLVLWIWLGRLGWRMRWIPLLLLAVSPIVVQAFQLGRPDHQSLNLTLIALGLIAELMMWSRPGRRAAVAWALIWGIALWTSLFEPLIVFASLAIIRICALRREAFRGSWRLAWGVFFGVCLAAILIDGWRIDFAQDPEVLALFPAWATMLGELTPVPPFSGIWFQWLGWGAILIVPLAIYRTSKDRDPFGWVWVALVVGAFALTCWQLRWAPYFGLVAALALGWSIQAAARRHPIWLGIGFLVSLWPVAAAWEESLFPPAMVEARRAEQRAENIELRELARSLRAKDQRPFLAPWWISPPIAYWSGQPGVAGSSHQSLGGIADTARFFLGDPERRADIITERGIRYLVFDDPNRMLETSRALLREEKIGGDAMRVAPDPGRVIFQGRYFSAQEVGAERRDF